MNSKNLRICLSVFLTLIHFNELQAQDCGQGAKLQDIYLLPLGTGYQFKACYTNETRPASKAKCEKEKRFFIDARTIVTDKQIGGKVTEAETTGKKPMSAGHVVLQALARDIWVWVGLKSQDEGMRYFLIDQQQNALQNALQVAALRSKEEMEKLEKALESKVVKKHDAFICNVSDSASQLMPSVVLLMVGVMASFLGI